MTRAYKLPNRKFALLEGAMGSAQGTTIMGPQRAPPCQEQKRDHCGMDCWLRE